MTLAQYLDYQRIASKKGKTPAEETSLSGYVRQMATETLPSLPKGTNGPTFTAPDKG